jgi:hypothetical protein
MTKTEQMLELIESFIDDPESSQEEKEGWKAVRDELIELIATETNLIEEM